MTDRKGTMRRRRTAGVDAIPKPVTEWFTSGGQTPWDVLLEPNETMAAWWSAWRQANPTARLPADAPSWVPWSAT